MASRLSRRLTAVLCAGLLALTVLVGTVVTVPSGLVFNPQPDPPGKQGSSIAFDPQPEPPSKQGSSIAFDPQPIPPGKQGSSIAFDPKPEPPGKQA